MTKDWTADQEAAALHKRFDDLKSQGVGQAEFARKYSVPGGASMVSQHIKGRRPIGLEAAVCYAAGFGCSIDEISPRLAKEINKATTLTPSNITPGPTIRGSVPLLSSIQAGTFKDTLSKFSGNSEVEQIATTVQVNQYTFALRVQGDSMEPKFTEGMILIVEPELDPQNGDFVIVKNGSDETTFKKLVRDGDDWLLKPLNDRYPIKPLGKNTIIGVVRGVTEQFR